MRDRRAADRAEVRTIHCRVCFEQVELDPARMEDLGGRTFIECLACRNLVRLRRGDLRKAVVVSTRSTDEGAAGDPGEGASH